MKPTKKQLAELSASLEGSVAGASLDRAIKAGRTDDVFNLAVATYIAGGEKICGRRAPRPQHSKPIRDYVIAGPKSSAKDGLDPWCAEDRDGYGTDANPVLNPRTPKSEESAPEANGQAKKTAAKKASTSKKVAAAKPAEAAPTAAEAEAKAAEQGEALMKDLEASVAATTTKRPNRAARRAAARQAEKQSA